MGLNLILVARRADLLTKMADELTTRHGIECRTIGVDLAEITAIEQINAATNDLDVGLLAASAGFGTSGRFVEALAVELKPHGVDVLAAAPGPTNSGFAQRANMQMGAALSPAVVARSTLHALGCTPTVLPGLLSKVLVYALALLPRTMRVRIMGQVMQGMTKHQGADAVKLQVR